MDCPSCGAVGQQKARCEVCGFAFPVGDASGGLELSLFLGLVCTACDAYNDPGTPACTACGTALDPVPVDTGASALVSDSVAVDSVPVDSVPVDSVPVDSVPVDSVPVDSVTVDRVPVDSVPVDRVRVDSVPVEIATGDAPAVPASAATRAGGEPPPIAPSSAALPPFAPLPFPPSRPAAAPLASPAWMNPPSGEPLTSGPALPRVDLGALGAPTPLAAPAVASPRAAAGRACWRCAVPTEPGDKFCRNCGARCDGGASATASPGSTSSAGSATTVLPAARVVGGQPPGSSPGSSPAPASPSATMFFGAVTVERSAKLLLVRGHTQFGSQWRLQAGETAIGRNTGVVLFPDDAALADRHARLVFRGPDLFLEPAPSTNGVFVRLRAPVQLHEGDEFIVGQQRLRLLPEHERPRAVPPPPPGTLLLGSATRASPPALALARITPDPTQVEVYVRHQRLLTLGRTHCDVNFPVDGFVSERHAQLTHEGDHVLLEDLKSRNGTYVRATGSWRLAHGDLLLLGEQVLRVELQQR